ncbi:MAG TPA: FixH family protein [Methylomirabilota bacterium]|jgi:hypothetical protein|nr:FixH family protein [Methylomirabilota bacterium]
MRAALILLAAAGAACARPAPEAVAVELACAPARSPLEQRCSVRLTDRNSGRPLEGARVTLHADMPSMPLAHAARPVSAVPGARPGTYEGTLELEMPGRWVVAVRIAGPVSDQVTRVLDVSP